MKILKLSEKNRENILSETVKLLKNGGVLALPTDTVFGLIALAKNEKAVLKIFKVKNRPVKKPLSLFVSSIAMAGEYAEINPEKIKILKNLERKGILENITFILPLKSKTLPRALIAGGKTVGVRIPKDDFILEILEKLKAPLAQTSANISGQPPAANIAEIKKYFKGKKNSPDLAIDDGKTGGGLASTVLDLSGDQPVVSREGAVSKKELEKVFDSRIFNG